MILDTRSLSILTGQLIGEKGYEIEKSINKNIEFSIEDQVSKLNEGVK